MTSTPATRILAIGTINPGVDHAKVGQVRALLDNRMGEALEVGLTAGAVRSV